MTAKTKVAVIGLAILAVVTGSTSVYAALTDTTDLSQTISAGTLATFIGDTSGNEVASPSIGFAAKTISGSTQTSAGTYGSNTQRIYVDNPGAVTGANGWTVTFAATSGASATWTSGGDTYPFNGATSADGQLTVDPSGGSLTADVGSTTGITLGTSSTFSGGSNTPITIMSASSTADDINKVYLTGVSLSQTIPAATPAGTYTINFTQTVAQV